MEVFKTPDPFQWPIPSTFIAKLGLLVYTNRLGKEHISAIPMCERLVAATRKDPEKLSDPTFVYFSGEKYCVEVNGEAVNPLRFSMLELTESYLRLARLREDYVEENDYTTSVLEKLRNEGHESLKEKLCFHRVLPLDGEDMVKLYDWDVSNLTLMTRKIVFPRSALAERSGVAVAPVPIFRYPTQSEERASDHMVSAARIDPYYGPEVIVNGLLLNAIEEIVLKIICNPKMSPLEDDLLSKTRIYQKNFDVKDGSCSGLDDPGLVRDSLNREQLANSISFMPLSDRGLRFAGFFRDMTVLFCLYHEEAHMRLGHIKYLDTCQSVIHRSRLVSGRVLGHLEGCEVEEMSSDERSNLEKEYVFNECISQIMELEADSRALRNSFILFSGIRDDEVYVKDFIIILFSVTVLVGKSDELHSTKNEETHPDIAVRFYSFVLQFCNLFVRNEKLLSPFDSPSQEEFFLKEDPFELSEVEPLIVEAQSWIANFSDEFGLNLSSDEVKNFFDDVRLLLAGDVSHVQQIELVKSSYAKYYCDLCVKKKNGCFSGLEVSRAKFDIAFTSGFYSRSPEGRSDNSGREEEYWPL